MALTGNAVKDTYLDLVQLEQSGAGLPSHAGKAAAVYDGGGNQIISQLAIEDWLQPHPDATSFAETFEFSTYGDANQAALEADGWTFENATGEVVDGIFWLTASSATNPTRAYLTVSFAGDFDVVADVIPTRDYGLSYSPNYVGGLAVGDSVGDVCIGVHCGTVNGYGAGQVLTGMDWASPSGGANTAANIYNVCTLARIFRISGANRLNAGSHAVSWYTEDEYDCRQEGWQPNTNVTDSRTWNRLAIVHRLNNDSVSGAKIGVRSIRRFQ